MWSEIIKKLLSFSLVFFRFNNLYHLKMKMKILHFHFNFNHKNWVLIIRFFYAMWISYLMKSKIWYHFYVVKLFLEGRIWSPFIWYGLLGWELCFDGRIRDKHYCPWRLIELIFACNITTPCGIMTLLTHSSHSSFLVINIK